MTSSAASFLPKSLRRTEFVPLVLIGIVWSVTLVWHPRVALIDDVDRFVQIATTPGMPYTAFPVEYPPLATLLIRMIGGAEPLTVALRVAALNAAATLVCWLLLRSRWSVRAGSYFLLFVLPLQVFMPYRLDAVAVVLTVAAVAFADAERQMEGGLAFAGAILFRLWPAVLLPGLLLRGRRKAFVGAIIATVIGGIVWIAFFGLDALRQVLSFREASGWHIESVYGLWTALVGGLELRFEAGAQRVGTALPWEIATTRLITIAVIGWIWIRARGRRGDAMGRPALAAVASLILFSPVSSPQYIVWLTPWAAVAAAEEGSRDIVMLMIYVTVFASATFLGYWGNDDPRLIVFMAAARAVCLLGLVLVGAFRYADGPPTSIVPDRQISP